MKEAAVVVPPLVPPRTVPCNEARTALIARQADFDNTIRGDEGRIVIGCLYSFNKLNVIAQ